MSEYKAGKAIVTNGSDQVLGIGTSWLTYAKAGDTLTIGLNSATILSIEDNNSLTLTDVWAFDSAFKSSYSIQEYPRPEKPEEYYDWDVAIAAWVENLELCRTIIITRTINYSDLFFNNLYPTAADRERFSLYIQRQTNGETMTPLEEYWITQYSYAVDKVYELRDTVYIPTMETLTTVSALEAEFIDYQDILGFYFP